MNRHFIKENFYYYYVSRTVNFTIIIKCLVINQISFNYADFSST